MKHKNQYTPEFKRRALELIKDSDKSIAQVAKELDLKANTLYNWHQLALKNPLRAFTNRQALSEQKLEIKHLKAKIAELEEEKSILK